MSLRLMVVLSATAASLLCQSCRERHKETDTVGGCYNVKNDSTLTGVKCLTVSQLLKFFLQLQVIIGQINCIPNSIYEQSSVPALRRPPLFL